MRRARAFETAPSIASARSPGGTRAGPGVSSGIAVPMAAHCSVRRGRPCYAAAAASRWRTVRQPHRPLRREVVPQDPPAQRAVAGARELVQQREAWRRPLLELLLGPGVDVGEQLEEGVVILSTGPGHVLDVSSRCPA